MDNTEYKNARKILGIQTLSEWLVLIGISISTHKSYSVGRLPVNQLVKWRIESLFERKSLIIYNQNKEKNFKLILDKLDFEIGQLTCDFECSENTLKNLDQISKELKQLIKQ